MANSIVDCLINLIGYVFLSAMKILGMDFQK